VKYRTLPERQGVRLKMGGVERFVSRLTWILIRLKLSSSISGFRGVSSTGDFLLSVLAGRSYCTGHVEEQVARVTDCGVGDRPVEGVTKRMRSSLAKFLDLFFCD